MIGRFLFYCIVVFIFSACGDEERKVTFVDEELMIEIPESGLYVRMRGNDKGPLLINLHGGPGGYSGIDINLTGPGLEKNYLVAYLDQRGCGKSLPVTAKSLLTVEQYVEDLDIVVDFLCRQYKKEKVNLMGTSWGGMYGLLYLLKNQDKVNAFACIDGKADSHYQNHSLIDHELSLISALLETQDSVRREELTEMQQELVRIKNSNFENFHTDVNRIKHEFPPKLGFNAYFADTSKVISLDDVLKDTALLNLMKYSEEEYLQIGEKAEFVNEAFRNTPSYNTIDITDELKSITVPVAVIQGEKDYVVGTGHAEIIYTALTGLETGQKELHILPGVGHCPAIESPEELVRVLNSFFAGHN